MAEWRYYDCNTGGWYRYEETSATANSPMITYAASTAWTCTNATFSTTATTSLTGNWSVPTESSRAALFRWEAWRARGSVATSEAVTRAEAFRARYAARRPVRESAEAKAEALLLRHLDPAQREQYRRWGYFDVEVRGHVYRLERGYAGNVTRRDPVTRRSVRRYCAHIDMSLPVQDNLLAQLFTLRNDEQAFLRVANVS